MTLRRVHSWKSVLPLVGLLTFPPGLAAQQDKVAALKQSLAANQKLERQYRWLETTVISMKGEEKSRAQKQCFYGPDGKVQKQQLSAPPPAQAAPSGIKGKIAAKKKEEITATMKQAVALVKSYVPPDSQRIQSVKAAGNLALVPTGPEAMRLDLRNYLKSGDSLSLGLDTARYAILTVSVKSYLESEKDAVTLDVTFARLREGLSYPNNIVLNVPGEKIQVVVENSNYQRVTPTTTSAKPAKPSAADTAIDTLVGPIALYPDALIAQILEASKDFAALQKYAGWAKSNSALKGTELQDAAQKAGFAVSYVALAPFPQVIQMLVEKPDWTKQLGAAYTSDQDAVHRSVQRLREAAMALGNLKTTPQQEVVTETTSTGQTIILVQPANPQVVYVPVYSPQVVYVQPAPPPPPPSASSSDVAAAAVVGFTVGIIIGASSNHYYAGPYAWHGGGAAYHNAYHQRQEYYEDRYENRQDYAEDRAENARENQDQRQSQSQSNQSQRQTAAQGNQAQRQSAAASNPTAQANQAQRQSTAQTNQASRQTSGASTQTAQANQAQRQSTAQASQASRQTAASTSGYQSGGSARAQSARGSASRSGSRSGGGGRRR